jgi:hypothetical protein
VAQDLRAAARKTFKAEMNAEEAFESYVARLLARIDHLTVQRSFRR